MVKDFKWLQSDRAYKTGAYISGMVLLLSLFLETHVLDNKIVASFASSFFTFFIAIWLGTSKKDQILGDFLTGYFKATLESFRATFICKIFIFLSISLFILGIYLTIITF